MKRTVLLLVLLIIGALLLSACGVGTTGQLPPTQPQEPITPEEPAEPESPGETETEKKVYYKVMVTDGEGFTVKSENPIEVLKGEDAVFDIEIAEGYAFKSVSVGEYDQISAKLTVENVKKRTTVTFSAEAISVDEIGKQYVYAIYGTDKDTSSILSFSPVDAGTLIKVNAGDLKKNFVGWSFGKNLKNGGEIVSTSREFEFRVSAELADAISFVAIYPNYSEANVFYYDPMGGVVNAKSFNMSDNEYYDAEYGIDGRVKITLLDKYFNYAECASTFWDDATFKKDGYILREYNTMPDGSGEAYSLGSKYFPVSEEGGDAVLYCIWEKANEASDFIYDDVVYAKPREAIYADHWVENGVIIKAYLGDAERVVVPETINGKPVTVIGSGAFKSANIKSVLLPKSILRVDDGAFVGCSSLETLYFPDGVYSVSDAAFDSATYASFKNLIVNAVVAPRYANTQYGAFAVKLCRVLSAGDQKMMIFVAGSSTYQGLATEYLEALLDGEYRVINYGTTRTRPGYLYMEALAHYTDSDDIMIFSPENSAFMLGENIIKENMLYDLEGVYNLYRYIDFSKYEGYLGALSDLNKSRFTRAAVRYEQICNYTGANKYGDYQHETRKSYVDDSRYKAAYYVTFNERIKSINEGSWSDVANQEANKDYTDPSNITWTSLDRPELLRVINLAIDKVKATGAKVYFAFAPTDANAVVEAARDREVIEEYDELIESVYHFDALIGSAPDYVFDHKYFYDCAYHVNDYGRAYRTYALYRDMAELVGITDIKGIYAEGEDFEGCLFENGSDGDPITEVDFLK